MAKTRINIRQVDFELEDGQGGKFETMSDATVGEGSKIGKFVPAKFNPKFLGVDLAPVDYIGVDSKTIVNKGLLDNLHAALAGDIAALDANMQAADNAIGAAFTAADASLEVVIAALQADVDGNESDADAAIAALQADVDGNEADADTALANATLDRGSIRTEMATADASLKSLYEAADASLTTRVAGEELARSQGDASLTTALASESASRIAADAAQDAFMNGEFANIAGAFAAAAAVDAAHDVADASLDTKIGVLAGVTSTQNAARVADIAAVDGRVDAILSGSSDALDTFVEVVQAYEAADGNLQTSITTLSTNAASDRASIRTEMDTADASLKSLYEAADASLTTRVAGEELARSQADASLTARILAEEGTRAANDSAQDAFMNGEFANISAAFAAAAAVDAAHDVADASLDTKIGVLAGVTSTANAARVADIAALQADVDGNEADADAAIAALQADVDGNEADADAAFASATADRAAVRSEMATADASVKSFMLAITDNHLDYIQDLQADINAMYSRHYRDSYAVLAGGDYVATLSYGLEPLAMQVFVNGLLKKETDDYTVSLGVNGEVTSVTVLSAEAGDDVYVMGQKYFDPASV